MVPICGQVALQECSLLPHCIMTVSEIHLFSSPALGILELSRLREAAVNCVMMVVTLRGRKAEGLTMTRYRQTKHKYLCNSYLSEALIAK